MQPDGFLQAEEQVHVVDRLAARAFQEVVDHGNDQQLVFVFLEIDEALVRVHDLFQVRVLVRDEGERVVLVIFLVDTFDLIQADLAVQVVRRENATREIAPHRDEVDRAVETVLQLPQALSDLGQVLVRERLVDRDVVIPPAEMGGRRRLDACACRTGDGVHVQVRIQHQMLGQGQDPQLDAGGETAGVRDVAGVADAAPVQFGQAVNEIVFGAFDPVVHAEVDDLHVFGHAVALHELLRVAVGGTEEEEVDLVQRQFVGEHQIRLAVQSAVHIGDLVAGIARAVDKCNLRVRMVQEQADQFACRVSCTSYNPDLDHISSFLWLL